jgi:hypothetical protein
MTRVITRVTLSDDSTVAEAWELTAEPCPWCGTVGAVWRDPAAGDYRCCTGCRRGGEPDQVPHTPATNETFAAIVSQLERAGTDL